MNVPVSKADIIVICCIVILMGYGVKLVYGFFHEGKTKLKASEYSGKGRVKIFVQVDGMMCGQCEAHVNESVRKNCHIEKVSSSHTKGLTTIIAPEDISDGEIRSAIESTGYTVQEISRENI